MALPGVVWATLLLSVAWLKNGVGMTVGQRRVRHGEGPGPIGRHRGRQEDGARSGYETGSIPVERGGRGGVLKADGYPLLSRVGGGVADYLIVPIGRIVVAHDRGREIHRSHRIFEYQVIGGVAGARRRRRSSRLQTLQLPVTVTVSVF